MLMWINMHSLSLNKIIINIAHWLYMYRPSLYNPRLCMIYKAEGLWWQTVWRSKNCLFHDWMPVSLPSFFPTAASLSLSLCAFLPSEMKWEGTCSLQHEQWWHYCHCELPIVAVCQNGHLPSGCHHGARMRCENFGEFIEGEIKHGARLIWNPYLHGISPLRHRQASQLDPICGTCEKSI